MTPAGDTTPVTSAAPGSVSSEPTGPLTSAAVTAPEAPTEAVRAPAPARAAGVPHQRGPAGGVPVPTPPRVVRDEDAGPGPERPEDGWLVRLRRAVGRPSEWSVGRRVVVGLCVAAVGIGSFAAVDAAASPEPPREVSLSEALTLVEDGDVAAATVDDAGSAVVLELAGGEEVRTTFPAAYADEMTQALLDGDVELGAEAGGQGVGAELLVRLLPVLLIVGVLLLVLRLANPNQMFGGSKKKALAAGEVPQVTFADVAGADEAVDQLREMVQLLRHPEQFEAVGATRPRGALLVGPPGTGKTLLARAVAGEAEVPFFALAGSDFVETFVGVGARRVRDLFAEARKAERAIIFIDEIDAVGRARSEAGQHNTDGERENTLISLLNEMDGFAGSQIVVLAATNRPDTLDPALTRPGRLDRQVQVPNPDRRGRTLILQVHAASRPVADDVDFVQIARQTPGMSGADLAQVVNEACMEAARRGVTTVDADCFQAAVATVAMGRARTSALVTEFDRRITAWHEAGHTLAAALLPDADDPVSVTIVPRGPAGGVTWMSGNDDIFLPRRKALAQLTVALAGRAAEEYLLDGEFTQGASGDLQSATNLARAMVTKYGMTDFGYAQLDDDAMRLGGQVAAAAHAAVDGLLRDAHRAATELLAAHGAVLEALASALLVEETLPGARVRAIIAQAQAAVDAGELQAVQAPHAG